ncbi:NlpC/P60 family protein [Desulfosporosinus sp.]|uniref:C40 family peptidase n=1 Tax=Desulfosporosinus sp. TaxID=157907 RepID=UPI0025C5AA2C|nr:NlpC/P60 family protein [Desulfosporosinus sp.]MBC2724712.1 C40 family peptidase [Desulfosporosinus sp.]MBC2726135.1 C40 family peptidase [Desulfosporosinus sp.]
MKKLISLAILGAFLMLAPAQTVQAAVGDTLLRFGSTGSDVVELQTELNYLGYNVGIVDGIFGSNTQAAVKAFQTAQSLSSDGIVGPITGKQLNSLYITKDGQSNNTQPRQEKVNAIISTTKKYMGVPYLWGGTSPETGFDCSGYVQYVFAKNGISLPRVSRDQYTVGTPVAFNNLQPGDLVFFSMAKNGNIDHDGIYIGNGQFINSSSSKGVTTYNLGPYWKSVYVGAKRVF